MLHACGCGISAAIRLTLSGLLITRNESKAIVELPFPARRIANQYVPGRFLSCISLALIFFASSLAAEPPNYPKRTLQLDEFLHLVLQRNENLQLRVLEFKISQKRLKAERGVFEPDLVLGYDRVENRRENTAEQRRSSGVAVFDEKNNVYNAGIE